MEPISNKATAWPSLPILGPWWGSNSSFLFVYPQHQESGLHIAVWHGFPRIVEILCQAGANLDIKNEVNN